MKLPDLIHFIIESLENCLYVLDQQILFLTSWKGSQNYVYIPVSSGGEGEKKKEKERERKRKMLFISRLGLKAEWFY